MKKDQSQENSVAIKDIFHRSSSGAHRREEFQSQSFVQSQDDPDKQQLFVKQYHSFNGGNPNDNCYADNFSAQPGQNSSTRPNFSNKLSCSDNNESPLKAQVTSNIKNGQPVTFQTHQSARQGKDTAKTQRSTSYTDHAVPMNLARQGTSYDNLKIQKYKFLPQTRMPSGSYPHDYIDPVNEQDNGATLPKSKALHYKLRNNSPNQDQLNKFFNDGSSNGEVVQMGNELPEILKTKPDQKVNDNANDSRESLRSQESVESRLAVQKYRIDKNYNFQPGVQRSQKMHNSCHDLMAEGSSEEMPVRYQPTSHHRQSSQGPATGPKAAGAMRYLHQRFDSMQQIESINGDSVERNFSYMSQRGVSGSTASNNLERLKHKYQTVNSSFPVDPKIMRSQNSRVSLHSQREVQFSSKFGKAFIERSGSRPRATDNSTYKNQSGRSQTPFQEVPKLIPGPPTRFKKKLKDNDDFPTFNSIPCPTDPSTKDRKQTLNTDYFNVKATSPDSKDNTGDQITKFQDFYTIEGPKAQQKQNQDTTDRFSMRMASVDAKKPSYPMFKYENDFGDSEQPSSRIISGQQRQGTVFGLDGRHETTTGDASPGNGRLDTSNQLDCSVFTNDVSQILPGPNQFNGGGRKVKGNIVEYFNQESHASTKEEFRLLREKVQMQQEKLNKYKRKIKKQSSEKHELQAQIYALQKSNLIQQDQNSQFFQSDAYKNLQEMNNKLKYELDCERGRKHGARDNLLEDLTKSYESKLIESKRNSKNLSQENIKIINDCKEKDEQIKQLIMEIESKQQNIDQLQEDVQSKDEDIQHRVTALSRLESKLVHFEKQFEMSESLIQEHQGCKKTIMQRDEEIKSKQVESDWLKRQNHDKQLELDLCKDSLKRLKEHKNAFEEENRNLMQLLKDSAVYKSAAVFENRLSNALQRSGYSTMDRIDTSVNYYKKTEEETLQLAAPLDKAEQERRLAQDIESNHKYRLSNYKAYEKEMVLFPNHQKEEPYREEEAGDMTFEKVSELQKSQSSMSENNLIENFKRISQEIKQFNGNQENVQQDQQKLKQELQDINAKQDTQESLLEPQSSKIEQNVQRLTNDFVRKLEKRTMLDGEDPNSNAQTPITFTMEEQENASSMASEREQTGQSNVDSMLKDSVMTKIKSNNQQLIEKENRLSALLDEYKQRIEQNKQIQDNQKHTNTDVNIGTFGNMGSRYSSMQQMKPPISPISKKYEQYSKNIDDNEQKPVGQSIDLAQCLTGRYIDSTIEDNTSEVKSEKYVETHRQQQTQRSHRFEAESELSNHILNYSQRARDQISQELKNLRMNQ